MATPNWLSGDDRRSRIEDLAHGDQTLEQLAEKYGIAIRV
jgi:hypothetical protein